MNSKNSKTSDPNRLVLNLPDKIDLRRDNECIAFSNLSMYYRLENIKKLYKTINSQILDPNWNEKFELAYGSYAVSDIQSYIECFIKDMKYVW